MNISLTVLGTVLVTTAVILNVGNYYKQMRKTVLTKHSTQVSTSAYMMNIGHYICSVAALAIFSNWVGCIEEATAGLACFVTFLLVVKYKPKRWHLINRKRK
jgi:hypothetical protein